MSDKHEEKVIESNMQDKDQLTEEIKKNEKNHNEAIKEKKEEKEFDINENIFINETDTFDIKVKWYKIDNQIYVNHSDTDFDDNHSGINEFTVTLKHPSQGDYESIMRNTNYKSPDEMKMIDFIQLELIRLITLIRKWSLKQELSRMIDLDPVIIKSIIHQVRDKIGMKGII